MGHRRTVRTPSDSEHSHRPDHDTSHRLARDRPRFPLAPQPAPPHPPQLDVLELVKFICKDLWLSVFDKQVDNLRTNHRGVYVISDLQFASLRGLSPVPVPGPGPGPGPNPGSEAGATTIKVEGARAEEEDEDEQERRELQAHVNKVCPEASPRCRVWARIDEGTDRAPRH